MDGWGDCLAVKLVQKSLMKSCIIYDSICYNFPIAPHPMIPCIFFLYSHGPKSKTALYWAADHGDNHLIQLLLGIGADPNLPAEVTSRPIVPALETGNRSVSKMLMSCGAETNFRTKQGLSLSEVAKKSGLKELSEELAKRNQWP